MNAYAHRDWEHGSAVMVEIFNDAVEIISPGWFVEGQDPDEYLSGKSVSPKSRNQLIAQTLFMSGDIESQGTGIKRIKDFCDEAGMSVEYVRTPDGTKLIFHRSDAFGQSLTVDASPTDVAVIETDPVDRPSCAAVCCSSEWPAQHKRGNGRARTIAKT